MGQSEGENPDMTANPQKSRVSLRGLQVLRGIAAFLVVVTHSGFYASERLDKGFHFWSRGAVGVDIFFVLSGFVMYYSSSSLRVSRDGWKIFIERRLVRIVPLYWLATSVKLLIMFAAMGLILHAQLSVWKTICAYLFLPVRNIDHLFMPVLGVGWTLNFEMFFYFLFAIAMASRRNVVLIVGCVLAGLAIGSYFIAPDGPAITFYLDPVVLDFLWGMLLAYVYEKRSLAVSWWVSVPVLAIGFYVILTPTPFESQFTRGIAAAAIIGAAAYLEPYLGRIPRLGLYLGDASYAIYLFSSLASPAVPELIAKAHISFLPMHVLVTVSIVLSVLVGLGTGCLIHTLIELPMTSFFREHIRFHGRTVIHLPQTGTGS